MAVAVSGPRLRTVDEVRCAHPPSSSRASDTAGMHSIAGDSVSSSSALAAARATVGNLHRAHGRKCPTLPMSGWISQPARASAGLVESPTGCHDVGMLAALPPGQPGKGQLHEAFDIARVPVELDGLIDCD